MKKSKIKKGALLVLYIPRQDIESFDHIDLLNALFNLHKDAKNLENRFDIMVSGYDDDERELYQIQEVKEYFDFLDRCFPYWFYYLNKNLSPSLSPMALLISLLVPVTSVIHADSKIQSIEIDMNKLNEFINIHFHFQNELTDKLGLSEEESIRISDEVINNIKAILR